MYTVIFRNQLSSAVCFRFCGQVTSISYIMCANAPENNKSLQNETEKESEREGRETRTKYEDAVLQHVDVMKNRLSPVHSSPLSETFCSSAPEILVIILLTSCVNCGIFFFIAFCRGWGNIPYMMHTPILPSQALARWGKVGCWGPAFARRRGLERFGRASQNMERAANCVNNFSRPYLFS